MFAHLWDGAIAATQITVGKAASRSLPTFFGLPQQGMTGLAVRAATGVALGWVVENVSPIRVWGLGEKLTEGALVGAIEDLMVAYHVPWIGPALAAPPGMLLGTGGGTTGGGRYQLASGTTRAPASRMLTGGRYDRTLSGGRPSRGNVGAVPSQGMPTQSYYG